MRASAALGSKAAAFAVKRGLTAGGAFALDPSSKVFGADVATAACTFELALGVVPSMQGAKSCDGGGAGGPAI